LYPRLRVEESPAYSKQDETEKMSNEGGLEQLYDTVAKHWPAVLIVAGLTVAFNVTNYMLTGYLPTYLDILGIPTTISLIHIIIVLAIVAILVTFLARLGDRIGKRPILALGCLLLIVVSIPMFLATLHGVETNSQMWIFLGILPEGLMLVCFMSCIPSTLP